MHKQSRVRLPNFRSRSVSLSNLGERHLTDTTAAVVHEAREHFKVFGWCSRHKFEVMIIVISNKFAIRCCLLGSSKRTGTEADHCVYFMI